MKRRDVVLSMLNITGSFPAPETRNSRKMPSTTPEWDSHLKPIIADVPDISTEERQARRDKAMRLMKENGIEAIFLEAGSSLFYFTGIRWDRSERMFAMLFPASGEPVYVVPAFEEGRSRELIPPGSEIRIWQEDESPAERMAQAVRDRGITGGIGIEESVRFFLFDNLRKAIPHADFVSADPVTAGCRMIKSTTELAILKRANRIALLGVATATQTLHEGITHVQFKANCEKAMLALGCPGEATITFGEETASPHGSIQSQKLKEGDTIVLDAVCQLHGYSADITRSFVFGKPSQRQREVWNLERKAQDAALAAVKPGKTCESIDAAARNVITEAGFGPDYRLPGLPHRTGHGIGLDVHEWPYLVRGNKRPLAPGMCFSNEPMIVIPGQFGIRLEDCFHVTETGAQTFTTQSPSIDQPFGNILLESV
jgi:Xaa-Pro dipeptidase